MGQDMKENIGGIFGKGDGFLHVWYVSLGLYHMKNELHVHGVCFPVHSHVCVSGHFNDLAAVAFLPPPRSPAKSMREPRFPPPLSH